MKAALGKDGTRLSQSCLSGSQVLRCEQGRGSIQSGPGIQSDSRNAGLSLLLGLHTHHGGGARHGPVESPLIQGSMYQCTGSFLTSHHLRVTQNMAQGA